MKSKRIEEHLSWINAKNSKQSIVSALKKFFSANNITNIDNYFKLNRDFKGDIKVFAENIRQLAPKTQNTYLSSVKVFFEAQKEFENIRIDNWFKLAHKKNGLKGRKISAITISDTPNNNDLKIILSSANLKEKALFGLMAVTGLRSNEALSLTAKEINMDDNSIKVKFDTAKNGHMRYVFFTDEVKQWLKQWIDNERQNWLKTSYQKSKYSRTQLEKQGFKIKREYDKSAYKVYKNGNEVDIAEYEKRIFPFSYPNVAKYWHRLLEKTGYNQKDGTYYHFNIHSLRRFFINTLKDSGINPNYKNYFSGHITDLEDAYENFQNYRLMKSEYFKYSNAFGIFTERKYIDSQMNDLQKQLDSQKRESSEKDNIIVDLQKQIKSINDKYNKEQNEKYFDESLKELREENETLQNNFSILLNRFDDLMDKKAEETEKARISARLNKKMGQ